jgi:hypothetical protein
MSIYDLSEAELRDAFDESARAVRNLLGNGWTYAKLAREIGVGESALKQFVRRDAERGDQPIRRGAAFDRIYRYIALNEAEAKAEPAHRPSLAQLLAAVASEHDAKSDRELNEKQRMGIYGILMKMLGVKADAVIDTTEKILNRKKFYCIRNAIARDFVVISVLDFRNLSPQGQVPIWEFSHTYQDHDGIQKKSDGVVLVMHNNIYLLGDIGLGEGLDMFVIREPIAIAKFLNGFLVSIDDYHRPFFAQTVLIDSAEVEGASDPSLFSGDGLIPKRALRRFGVEGNPLLGMQLDRQLDIEESSSVLRIRKRYFIANPEEEPTDTSEDADEG